MTPEDSKFKKECQITYQKICNLLSKNKVKEAFIMIDELDHRAAEWNEYEDSVKFRSRLIRSLAADLISRKRVKTAELSKK